MNNEDKINFAQATRLVPTQSMTLSSKLFSAAMLSLTVVGSIVVGKSTVEGVKNLFKRTNK